MTVVPLFGASTVADMLPPNGHPEGHMCEWCMAIKRSSQARHPSVYRPPDQDIDFRSERGRMYARKPVKRMSAAKQLAEEKRALKRKEERQAEEELILNPVLSLVEPDHFTRKTRVEQAAEERKRQFLGRIANQHHSDV